MARLLFVVEFGTRVVAGSFGFGFDSQNKRGSASDKRERLKIMAPVRCECRIRWNAMAELVCVQ